LSHFQRDGQHFQNSLVGILYNDRFHKSRFSENQKGKKLVSLMQFLVFSAKKDIIYYQAIIMPFTVLAFETTSQKEEL